MKKLNLITVKILLATYADTIEGITDGDSCHMDRRLKDVDEFLEPHQLMIYLIDMLVEDDDNGR